MALQKLASLLVFSTAVFGGIRTGSRGSYPFDEPCVYAGYNDPGGCGSYPDLNGNSFQSYCSPNNYCGQFRARCSNAVNPPDGYNACQGFCTEIFNNLEVCNGASTGTDLNLPPDSPCNTDDECLSRRCPANHRCLCTNGREFDQATLSCDPPPSDLCTRFQRNFQEFCDFVDFLNKKIGVLASLCGGAFSPAGIAQQAGQMFENFNKIASGDGGPLTPKQQAKQFFQTAATSAVDVIKTKLRINVGSLVKVIVPGVNSVCLTVDLIGVSNAVCQLTAPARAAKLATCTNARSKLRKRLRLGGRPRSHAALPVAREIEMKEKSLIPPAVPPAVPPAAKSTELEKRSTNPCTDFLVGFPADFCTFAEQEAPDCSAFVFNQDAVDSGLDEAAFAAFKANCESFADAVAVAGALCDFRDAVIALEPFCDNNEDNSPPPSPSQVVLARTNLERKDVPGWF